MAIFSVSVNAEISKVKKFIIYMLDIHIDYKLSILNSMNEMILGAAHHILHSHVNSIKDC